MPTETAKGTAEIGSIIKSLPCKTQELPEKPGDTRLAINVRFVVI